MMFFDIKESLRSALYSIKAHSFRSFLTTLGIIIGVAAVIAMVSIIQGLSATVNQSFAGLGTNSLVITVYTPISDQLQGKFSRITPEDYEQISLRIDGIASLTPILNAQSVGIRQVRYASQIASGQIVGTTYTYKTVAGVFVTQGRFLSSSDDLTRRRVVVIGEDVRIDLSLPENPVGEFIELNGEWLKIIGLLEIKGPILGQSQDNQILLPYNTMQSIIGNQVSPNIQIQTTISDVSEIENVSTRITHLLRNTHHLGTEDEDDFRVQTSDQLASTVNTILDTVTLVMVGIVSISLLVGGIGIMNIMLVSVTERTREIGICKAIGAKRHQILLQFLFESIFLCLLGGLIGLILGYGFGMMVATVAKLPEAVVPLWAVLLSFGFSAFIGIVFGIVPAAKAANLDPIEALRYE